jgi:hypothetical protein
MSLRAKQNNAKETLLLFTRMPGSSLESTQKILSSAFGKTKGGEGTPNVKTASTLKKKGNSQLS